MKKSKLSIGLVTSFIGALALTSCNDTATVTKSKDSVVDLIGYNSKTDKIEINVDELYREYGEGKEGTTLYYNAILESLIRYEYPKIAALDGNDLKPMTRIEAEADDKVTALIQTARDNASNNGTKVEDEWDKILESNDVESKKELKAKFVYQLEKEAFSDWYFKAHSESTATERGLRSEYLGVDSDWNEIAPATENVDPVYPYHVIHILVKLSADATDYNRATISESEALKLWEVIQMLVDGQYDFEDATLISDDTSSDDYGDVELMSTKTSFYNEFKLGVYAYDAILSGVNSESADTEGRYKAFGLDSDAKVVVKSLNDGGTQVETEEYVQDLIQEAMLDNVNIHMEEQQTSIPAIPFDVFRQIGLTAKDDKIGTFEPEGNAASLPRNVLFNAFLNFRSPFVITNELLEKDSVQVGKSYKASEFVRVDTVRYATENEFLQAKGTEGTLYLYPTANEGEFNQWVYEDNAWAQVGTTTDPSEDVVISESDDDIATTPYEFDDKEILKLASHNFKEDKVAGLNKKVLCDRSGNVVIGVRSTAGIHFMVMRKSVFENTNVAVGKEGTSLEDYYTTKIPGEEGYPEGKETYVKIKYLNDTTSYSNRAKTIKDDIKSSNFDAAYDYRIYEALMNQEFDGASIKDKVVFSDEDPNDPNRKGVIRTNIEKTIELLRESSHYTQEESINNSWKEYLTQLSYQNLMRSDTGMYRKSFVPTTCAFSFTKGNEKMWEKDGACYVK